ASYANACGQAMNYCLAAPGTAVFTGTDDPPDAPDYWRASGTSFAAPQVSGAAALVWEAFPWFDNDLVRQTILGTATDLGDPGVDEIFGYGLLNVGDAVKGPGKFDWGTVTANFDDDISVWGNDISGTGGLVKRGSGTLVLE
ncbi:MAG: S8 family serine peptidase, partial [Luteimonas sp.]